VEKLAEAVVENSSRNSQPRDSTASADEWLSSHDSYMILLSEVCLNSSEEILQ
jgi:hypothetical protein